MRILLVTIQLALAAFLISCNQQDSAIDIEPRLGRECYESHRASLPPGTQYEGIEKVAENRLTIKIMDGVEIVKLDCVLNPDGTLQGADK